MHWLVGLLALAFLSCLPAARAGSLTKVTGVSLERLGDIERFTVTLDEPAPFTLFLLPDPERVVIDMSELAWARSVDMADGKGLVQRFRHGLFKPGTTRIVLDLSGPVQMTRAEMLPGDTGYRLEVDLKSGTGKQFLADARRPLAGSGLKGPTGSPSVTKSQETQSQAAAPSKSAPPSPPRERSTRTIVIDPGHGGVDPGAIAYNGNYEKNITLAIGLELRRALQKNRDYRVVMTRSTDVFIPLGERVNIARKVKADLFISVHADMLQDHSVRGATVYTLSNTASDKEAEQLAAKENKADIIGGIDLGAASADVTNILIDLAQRETMAYSTQLAGLLVPALQDGAGVSTHGMRSAGFRVLKAPDVPSILIETGYLSNPADVKFLTTKDGQRRISEAVRRAVDRYFSAHEARLR